VEHTEPERALRVRTRLKLPGKAWLLFESQAISKGTSRLVVTVFFEPKGLVGCLYWYLWYVPHRSAFGSTLKVIAKQAEESGDNFAANEAD
jgi:hypothetical protein